MTGMHLEDKKISRQFYLMIWIGYALIYMTKNCFSAAMAAIVYEGVLTKTQTGLIGALFFVFYGPLQIVGGLVADRYDPEKLICMGLICSGIINVLLFFFHSYITMLILWSLNGIAQFAIWPSIVKIITSQLAPADRKSGSFYIAFASIGGLLISYLTAALITRWEYNFLVSGVILLTLALLWTPQCHSLDRFMIRDMQPVSSNDQTHQHKYSIRHVFCSSGFYFIVLYFFLRTIVDQGIKSFAPTMLMELYPGVSPSMGNLLNIFILTATLIGAFIIRLLYPKRIRSEMTSTMLVSMIALPFCGVLLFAGRINMILVLIAMCVICCMLNCGTVLINSGNVNFSRYGMSATTAGIINSAASVAFIVVNYGVAMLADLYGWSVVTKVMFALIMVATVLISISVPKWKRFMSTDEE